MELLLLLLLRMDNRCHCNCNCNWNGNDNCCCDGRNHCSSKHCSSASIPPALPTNAVVGLPPICCWCWGCHHGQKLRITCLYFRERPKKRGVFKCNTNQEVGLLSAAQGEPFAQSKLSIVYLLFYEPDKQRKKGLRV